MKKSHLIILKKLAESKNYGQGPEHALQVSKLALKIPAETQNEKLFRLTGQGMPVLGSIARGDLLVKIKVVLPSGLSHEEKALFARLKEIRPA